MATPACQYRDLAQRRAAPPRQPTSTAPQRAPICNAYNGTTFGKASDRRRATGENGRSSLHGFDIGFLNGSLTPL